MIDFSVILAIPFAAVNLTKGWLHSNHGFSRSAKDLSWQWNTQETEEKNQENYWATSRTGWKYLFHRTIASD